MNFTDTDLADLYAAGHSCAAIADMSDLSATTTWKRLRAAGVEMRSSSDSNRRVDLRTAMFLYNIGLSTTQVGRLLGVHRTAVLKRLSGAGFPLRPRGTAVAVRYSEDEFQRFFSGDGRFMAALRGGG